MKEAFGPVLVEIVVRQFLVIARFISRRFCYGWVRESVSKVDGSPIALAHKAKGKPLNQERAEARIVRLYRSATLFD